MGITLKQAASLNGTPEIACFAALQAACKNTSYFNSSRPINHLSSWEGYYYSNTGVTTTYSIEITLANSSPDCNAGSTTATIVTKRKDVTTHADGSTSDTGFYLYDGQTPSISASCGWLSAGTVSRPSTGTYTVSVSFDCNCRTTSSRDCTITASGNSVSDTTILTQGADSYSESGGGTTYEYGSWGGGAITFNSTSDLSCGADSRTVYIQPWTRTVTTVVAPKYRDWVCGGRETISSGSRTPWTDYYTGAVSVSENGSYTSLNTSSYTASSSQATLTLSKSSCGTDSTSRVYVTVTATPSGPSATSNGIYQAANSVINTETNTGYQIKSISVDPASPDNLNGTFSVSYNIQKRTQTRSQYCSGSWTSWSSWSSWSNVNGAKPSVSSNQSWARINSIGSTNSSGNGSASGTYDENIGGTRSATITVSYGGASNSATLTQAAGPNVYLVPYNQCSNGWWDYEITINDQTLANGGGYNSGSGDRTISDWSIFPSDTTWWYGSVYFNDYNTLDCNSNGYSLKLYAYNSVGNVIDETEPIYGTCGETTDVGFYWLAGRPPGNADIFKIVIEVSFN